MMRSIYFKELYMYFATPLFSVVTGVFVCLAGIFFFHNAFYASLAAAQTAGQTAAGGLSLHDVLLRPMFLDLNMLVTFLLPLMSMQLYAGERSRGTMELLSSYPVSDLAVLLGKYLAALSVFVIMLCASMSLIAVMAFVVPPDMGVVLSSYAGIFLQGGAILAMGAFASALARSRIIAAVLTLGMVLVFRTVGWLDAVFPGSPAGALAAELSLVNHLSRFLNGIISVKDCVFYVEMSSYFLVLALMVRGSARRRA